MTARQQRYFKYTFMGIGVLLVLYLTLAQPPFHSLALRWGVRGAMLVFLVYGVLIEPRCLRVSRYTVTLEGLPSALDGLRIAHVTDFHVGAPGLTRWDYGRVINVIKRFQPDLIALTGDFVARNGWVKTQLKDCLPIQAKHGCFGVLGNSDRRQEKEVTAELESLGVHVLSNRSELVAVHGTTVAVVGVDDPSEGRDDLATALKGVPNHAGLTLLLAHSPDIAYGIAHLEVDLVLVGHTHGGQVKLPLLHQLLRKGGTRYRAGWFQVGKAKMFVNRGVGQVAPFRFLCPPEVALLTLLSQRKVAKSQSRKEG